MPDKKIAYIISRFPTLTETFIIREVEEIKKKGIDIEVFSLASVDREKISKAGLKGLTDETHYLPYLFSADTVRALSYFLLTQTSKTLKLLFRIIKTHIKKPGPLIKTLALFPKALTIAGILRKEKIRRIHAHWATVPTTIAWVISELNNCEYTFTAHAWDIFKQDLMLEDKIRKARKVITCTKYNKEYLLDKYPGVEAEKIEVIYHGLDITHIEPVKREPNATFTILSVGRLVQKKGFDVLLKACAALIEKEIPFKCNIVYVKGELEGEIFRLYRELGLKNHVILIPEMPHEKLLEYYRNSDCFVLPSRISESGDRDGIPNVILEAFASGLAVISTNISGIPEVVIKTQTGLVVDPDNTIELTQAIEKLISQKELRYLLGQKGRDLVKENFEISENTDRLLKHLL